MVKSQQTGLYVLLLLLSSGMLIVALGPGLFGVTSTGYNWQYQAFAMLCHQDPTRSYTLNGVTMAVCSRCIGIYGSFFLGVMLMPAIAQFFGLKRQWTLKVLFGTILLNFIDVFSNAVGIWTNSLHSRLLLGIMAGFSAAILLTDEFFKQINKTENGYGK